MPDYKMTTETPGPEEYCALRIAAGLNPGNVAAAAAGYTETRKGQGNMAQEDQKIDYVEFPARDFDAVQSFYEQAFGWTFTDYGREYRAFSDAKLDGGFRYSDTTATVAGGSALVVLYADDLEATRDKVVASGGEVVVDIFSFPGGRRFQFTDPHGNELGVWSET